MQMVLDDEVQAMIADFPICQLSVMRHPEADLSTLMTPFTIEPLGIALPADDPLFINLIDNYLNTTRKHGASHPVQGEVVLRRILDLRASLTEPCRPIETTQGSRFFAAALVIALLVVL